MSQRMQPQRSTEGNMQSSGCTFPAFLLSLANMSRAHREACSAFKPCLEQPSILLYNLFLHISSINLLFNLCMKFSIPHGIYFVHNSRYLQAFSSDQSGLVRNLFTKGAQLVDGSLSSYKKSDLGKQRWGFGMCLPHWRGNSCTDIYTGKQDGSKRPKNKSNFLVESWLHLCRLHTGNPCVLMVIGVTAHE